MPILERVALTHAQPAAVTPQFYAASTRTKKSGPLEVRKFVSSACSVLSNMNRATTSRRLVAAMTLFSVVVLLTPVRVSADSADGVREFFGRAGQTPHPSVVQVLAPEPGALARGSGTLILTDGPFGYVITNWHVVRDAPGDVVVLFPDGHQSLARVLKTDEDWDLALLLIWRGSAGAVPLSALPPRPGERLTIAGYGGEGKFRAQQGSFTNYAAPEPDLPFEMFELAATARQGDSGGPIFNERGELAGVLFGAGDGRTTGTQVQRVREFVNRALLELHQRSKAVAQTATRAPLSPPIASQPAWSAADQRLPHEYVPPGGAPSDEPASDQYVTQTPMAPNEPNERWVPPGESEGWRAPVWKQRPEQAPLVVDRGARPEIERQPPSVSIRGIAPSPTAIEQMPPLPPPPRRGFAEQPSGGITWDQLKSFFAAVGVFAMLHTMAQMLFGVRKRE
jgi:serine protease Do